MTKEEALIKAKIVDWFLKYHPEWNGNKEVVLIAVQECGLALYYASDELRNDKDVVMAAVQQCGWYLEYASDELKNNKDVALMAVKNEARAFLYISDQLKNDREIFLTAIQSNACLYLNLILDDCQSFNEIVEKEGEEFLFSCKNNQYWKIRLLVANNPNFFPTVEQIEIGLQDSNLDVQQVYQLRQDEWVAKIEENKLKNNV